MKVQFFGIFKAHFYLVMNKPNKVPDQAGI